MDEITKALFTVDEQISGYRIFKLTEDSASTQKYDAELELLYIRWMSIKCNSNDFWVEAESLVNLNMR